MAWDEHLRCSQCSEEADWETPFGSYLCTECAIEIYLSDVDPAVLAGERSYGDDGSNT